MIIGRTFCTSNYIKNMEEAGIKVERFFDITPNMFNKFLVKNKGKIEEILIMYKEGKQ